MTLLPAARPGKAGWSERGLRRPHSSRFASACISLLVLLSVFTGNSSAQPDPVDNFCRRFGHQTAVIDRKLYIDGGFINYNPLSQYPTNYSNVGLHYHDLDRPGAGRMPQLYANLTKNSTIPSVSGGTLWADNVNKRFYLFGGEHYQQPPSAQFTLWSYDAIYDSWESFGSPAQDDIAAVSWGAGVSVPETGEGYYYGGWKSNNTVPGWRGPPLAVSDLVKYNMDANSWSIATGPDSLGRAEGAMVFIPVGDGGMLVYFGGVQDPHGNGTWAGQPMEDIFLYDVLSSKWYTQNASGQIPPMRRRFCAGATWALDQSSYNIYIYGGAGMPPDTAGFDDVYILTIPSFQWVKMYPTDGNLTGAYPHHSLSCNVIDNAQMIIIGGTFPTSERCDVPEQYGVHNVDMGEQNRDKALWQIFATNITHYIVPDRLIQAVGGSADGGATKTAPATGFTDPDLRVLMTRKATIPSRTPTRSISTATVAPEGDGNKPLSKGAIAGITVGGVGALVAFTLGVLFLIRCRRRLQARTKNPLALGPASSTYTPTSPYPHSPFLQQQQRHGSGHNYSGPAELPVRTPPPGSGVTSWLGPDGVTYELVNAHTAVVPDGAGSSTTETGTGTGNSGGGDVPLTKIDQEDRVWVQVPPGPGPVPGGRQVPGGAGAGGSPGGLARHHSGVGGGGYPPGMQMPASQQQHSMEPQELSGEPRRELGALGESAGWDAAHGRPRHQTFYHP
ncbi:autophagy-related protein 3 [Achaetomium macrosporum]|uniref:Autophagy-related protein 3 n=1 Tax=Achaetomium macrosporum TaxID=79813 RepID=A0AAN7CAQ0_9PEZI|nr:autophagy-related protein 3 [Achaetomium macrosporum]